MIIGPLNGGLPFPEEFAEMRRSEGEWLASLRWLHRLLPAQRPPITLDVFVPLSRVPRFLAWYRAEIGHFPLWCVPYRRVRDYEWVAPSFYAGLDDQLFLDLAIYGMRQPPGRSLPHPP